MSEAPLKLGARDAEDLRVIAAVAQDALVPLDDMAYLPDERRFVLALNRFRWDRAAADGGNAAAPEPARVQADAPFSDKGERRRSYERVLSGLTFENVAAVRTQGIDPRRREEILELLTIHSEPGAVYLLFAGGGTIKLEVSELRCYLQDFGEPWPTGVRPRHPGGPGGGPA
jgi:hypothetical protein